jgi:rubrerythrin
MEAKVSKEVRKKLLLLQQDEINSYHTYKRLANRISDEHNAKMMRKIAEQEKRHYEIWKNEKKIDPRPSFNLKKTIYAEVMNTKPSNHAK